MCYGVCKHVMTDLFVTLQSALAPLEQVLPQEVSPGGEIHHLLLAGDPPGVPQHADHLL